MGTISVTTFGSDPQTVNAANLNALVTPIITECNGSLDNTNIKAAAGIVDTKLAQITTASKVSGTAITGLASLPSGAGVIPTANLPTTYFGKLVSITAITDTGESTWTRPTGCSNVVVKCVGGGGGGAGGTNGYYSGGGASGGYSEKFISSPGATESVTVGAAGAGSLTTVDGVAGGNTSFGSHCTANGGGGGKTTTGTAAGGTATDGDLNLSGQAGGTPSTTNVEFAQFGGNTPMGFGFGGKYTEGSSAGSVATGYGAGGGGGVNAAAGANGTQGIIIVYAYQ